MLTKLLRLDNAHTVRNRGPYQRPWTTVIVAWLVAAVVVAASSPSYAQLSADAIPQLEMLDTRVDELVRLATEYADALLALKTARLSIETVQGLRPSAVVTNLEVQIARLNLEAAENKMQVLRAIAEKQLAAAENKLAIVKYFEQLGGAGKNGENQNYIRANDEATVRILKMILAMK
jgi:hypothetical protein